MRKILIKIIVLVPVFVGSLLFFNWFYNTRNEAVILQMEEPAFPTVSFGLGNEEFNMLNGYAGERHVPRARDTITPTDGRHTLSVFVHPHENQIRKIEYAVMNLSGEEIYESGEMTAEAQEDGDLKGEIQFSDVWADSREAVLEIKLTGSGDEPYYFYTRVTRTPDVNAESAIEFAKRLDMLTHDIENEQNIKALLEPNSDADNGTLQHVTMYCNSEQVMWKGVTLRNISDIQVKMTECNTVYCSLVLNYTIEAGNGTDMDLYNVREFYRIRKGKVSSILLGYDRQIDLVYEAREKVLTPTGLNLGVTDPDVDYIADKKGNYITYVAGDSIWQYQPALNVLTKIFSFRKEHSNDERDTYREHELKLLHMDDMGNVSFSVSGYMNSDIYEGKTGTTVYYYDAEGETASLIAYLPSSDSGEITIMDRPEVLYYSHTQEMLYLAIEGNLERLSAHGGDIEMLVPEFRALNPAVSEDSRYIAYQREAGAPDALVMDLETGESWTVSVGSREIIRPMGFIEQDLVYGISRESDAGINLTGDTLLPMYKAEIVSPDGEILKEYQQSDIYILSGKTEDGIVSFERCARNGTVYTPTQGDYISLNSDVKTSVVELEVYQDPVMQRSVRFKINRNLKKKQPRRVTARLLLNESKQELGEDRIAENSYYAYCLGKLEAISDQAWDAIKRADILMGNVIDKNGEFLWERGNRDLVYSITDVYPAIITGSPVASAIQTIMDYKGVQGNASIGLASGNGIKEYLNQAVSDSGIGEVLDLTGLTVEETCYLINQNIPVVALTGGNTAIVFTGYDEGGMIYQDMNTGDAGYLAQADAEAMCAAAGSQLLAIR